MDLLRRLSLPANVVQAFNEIGMDTVPSLRGIYNTESGKHYAWDSGKALHHDVLVALLRQGLISKDTSEAVLWRANAPLREVAINHSDWSEWKMHGDNYFRGFKVEPGSTDL